MTGLILKSISFQSTLPRGSDRIQRCIPINTKISIHAPSRERPSLVKGLQWVNGYFNPRSLAGATDGEQVSPMLRMISIHAPSRERPVEYIRYSIQPDISIHAPSRERRGASATSVDDEGISIHAPSRERRGKAASFLCNSLYFNPRSLAGATTIIVAAGSSLVFQSTLPRGSDRQRWLRLHRYSQFQSTLPRGSD